MSRLFARLRDVRIGSLTRTEVPPPVAADAPSPQVRPPRIDHVAALAASITIPAPMSLQPLIAQINALARTDELPRKIELLREAVRRLGRPRANHILQATLLTELGTALAGSPDGDPDRNLEQAISHFVEASEITSRAGWGMGYARTQAILGRAYRWRRIGNQRENLEQAIACCSEALCIFLPEESPREYAQTQLDLGQVYVFRVAGDGRQNLERAIHCCFEALRVWEVQTSAVDCAQAQTTLGLAYLKRIAGSRAENLERAIAHLNQALAVFTSEDFPAEHAETRNRLGAAYAERLAEDRAENVEQAIAHFAASLQVSTVAGNAFDQGRANMNLGKAYVRRIAGDRSENLEQAIGHFTQAASIWAAEHVPHNLALVRESLGEAYLARIAGDRRENVERAIACFEDALHVFTLADFPMRYAEVQDHLGRAYQLRVAGDRRENLARAAACFAEALRIYTPDEFPLESRNTYLDLAWLYFDAVASEAERRADGVALRDAWQRAHENFAVAERIQSELGWLEYDEQGRARLQSAHPGVREQYARDAWCLWQLGDSRAAVTALEAGRAQALAEAQAIAGAALDFVCAEHDAAFQNARQAWQEARVQDDRQVLRAAREAFLDVRQAIRAHCDPTFLPAMPEYREVARAAAPDQALVYVMATERGGAVFVVPPGRGRQDDDRLPHVIPLPRLSERMIDTWLVRRDAAGRVVGGYAYVVRESGARLLRDWLALAPEAPAGAVDPALPLHGLAPALPASLDTLRAAVEEMAGAWRAEADLLSGGTAEQQAKARELCARLATPVGQALDDTIVASDLRWLLREAELERLLGELHATFVADLRRALDALGLGDREQAIALVPCGRLSMLPIHAAWARDDPETGGRQPLLETCELTLQPSARALAAARAALRPLDALVAIGDPQPTAAPSLAWAEAEALAVVTAARQAGYAASQAITGEEATRARVTAALAVMCRQDRSTWIHAACHGHADPTDPTNCYLLLAYGERLTLADLQRQQLLAGVRGLVASGCVTGLGDVDTSPDELNSFAAGVLQAGAPCAVAMLWPVSDRATFLLMLRFAQGLLAGEAQSPARALRDAIAWLRRATLAQVEAFARRFHERAPGGSPRLNGRDTAERDATRALPSLWLYDAPADAVRMTPDEAFTLVSAPSRRWPPRERPYAHLVYWAAAVTYGA